MKTIFVMMVGFLLMFMAYNWFKFSLHDKPIFCGCFWFLIGAMASLESQE